MEPLSDEIIDDYILNALGIPLYFSRIKGKNMILGVQQEINNILAANNVALPEKQLVFFGEITTVPADDEIPYIVNYSRFLEDFYKRVAEAKIESIESYQKLNGLKGTEDKDFLIFRYKINIASSQESLRTFLNSLQNACKDNKVYVVRSISADLEEDLPEMPQYSPGKTAELVNPAKTLPGISDTIKTSITVDYVIFKRKILN